jgi:hypothetical protein
VFSINGRNHTSGAWGTQIRSSSGIATTAISDGARTWVEPFMSLYICHPLRKILVRIDAVQPFPTWQLPFIHLDIDHEDLLGPFFQTRHNGTLMFGFPSDRSDPDRAVLPRSLRQGCTTRQRLLVRASQ